MENVLMNNSYITFCSFLFGSLSSQCLCRTFLWIIIVFVVLLASLYVLFSFKFGPQKRVRIKNLFFFLHFFLFLRRCSFFRNHFSSGRIYVIVWIYEIRCFLFPFIAFAWFPMKWFFSSCGRFFCFLSIFIYR